MIAIGGAAGAISRYLLQGWVDGLTGGRLPWGTFVVNISGSFLLGVVFALAVDRAVLSRHPGAGHDRLHRLVHDVLHADAGVVATRGGGRLPVQLGNLIGSVVVGLVALVAGLAIGRLLP